MSWFPNKPADAGPCPTCKRLVLTAVDEGLRVKVDPSPLASRAAEITALVTGRRTYSLLPGGWLVYRSIDRMRLGGTVHTEHRCTRRAR